MDTFSEGVSGVGPTPLPLRFAPARRTFPAHELTVMRVRNFSKLMQLIATHDLWDELEAELAAHDCANFRISTVPMKVIGGHIRRKVSLGELPVEVLEQLATGSCLLCKGSGGGGGSDAGTGGGGSQPLKPGTSEGDPQDGGSKDYPQ